MAEIKDIPQITLIAVAGNKQAETIAAIYKSLNQIKPAKAILITNIDISASGIEVINVAGLKTWAEYNRFIVKELYRYFDTSHCLIIQHDGYVIDGGSWDDDFLNYDLIGARGLSDGRNNYNGGFTLRSLDFQITIAKDDFIDITAPEDEILCRLYRKYLEEKYNFRYCTDEIADRFSFEMHEPLAKTFGFHNYHWGRYKETIVFKRDGALGDVIMLEPVMHHFFKKGYQIALDTNTEFLMVYFQHYFPIIPKTHLNPKLPYKEIDMNMAYEIKPKQPTLKSYYEMAEVKDGVMRNSKLSLKSGENQKMFNRKYALIHIDSTGMPYRDCFGVNWEVVINYLESYGYLVFQIGRRVEKEIAVHLNTLSLEFMMFLVKGADLFIGLDSGIAQVSVGFDIPSVIMFGSVNPKLRYSNFKNIKVVQSACPKEETNNCYHNKVDVVGTDCIYDKKLPPCTTYTDTQIINAIKELI